MYGGLTASCTVCRRPGSEALRTVWGCDAPVKQATWSTGCEACGGRDPDCDVCNGTGEHKRYRCPSVEMGDGRDVAEIMSAYVMLDRFQLLPRAGGTLDQHPRFIKAVHLIESERAAIQKRDDDEMKAKAKKGKRGR